jgi:tetratricopeptide (TPR) repeat protein
MELQPVSYDNQQTYALALYYARRYNESEAEWKRLIPLNPNHPLIYGYLANCLEQQGKESEAFEYRIKEMVLRKEVDDEKIEHLKGVFATSGRNGITRERIKIAEAKAEPNPGELARLYASIRDKDKAFEYLEKASQLAVLKVDPQLDPLRNDPRYADLVRRVEEK